MKRNKIIEILIAAAIGFSVSLLTKASEKYLGLALDNLNNILGGAAASIAYLTEEWRKIFT